MSENKESKSLSGSVLAYISGGIALLRLGVITVLLYGLLSHDNLWPFGTFNPKAVKKPRSQRWLSFRRLIVLIGRLS